MYILRWYVKINNEYIKMPPDGNLLNPFVKHKAYTEHRRKNFKNLLFLTEHFLRNGSNASSNQW